MAPHHSGYSFGAPRFPASPPEHASANKKMLLHRVVTSFAVDPMLTRIRSPGHREASGRATSSAPPADGRKGGHRIEDKSCFPCCNGAFRAQVLIRNSILPNWPAGCQRSNARCKRRSAEKNSCTLMGWPRSAREASAPQVHRV
jgi:hypothetical protein